MSTSVDGASGRTPFSFEVYPPRTPETGLALPEVIDRLAAAHPDFISVTYGANGSSRSSSLALLRHIKRHTDVEPMAHLTCVGSSHAEANRLIREFLDAGITSFLALRGDPPREADAGKDAGGDIRSAGELVQLIHRVQAERVPYTELELPGTFGATAVKPGRRKVRVSVAAFPNGHPRSRSIEQDLDALLAKQAAGADFAITQLFFHADDYLSFVERARGAGVTMPILPGIMPVTTPARLRRIADMVGETPPADLLARLDVAASSEQRFHEGTNHAIRLARAVLDGGAPALHLYTFNSYEAVLAVLGGCGLVPQQQPSHNTKEPA